MPTFICNHAGDYGPCRKCTWSSPWESTWKVEQGKGVRLDTAPFPIYRMVPETKAFKCRHSPRANCPLAKGIFVPIRVLEVHS